MQSPEFAAEGIELAADEMKAVAEGKGFRMYFHLLIYPKDNIYSSYMFLAVNQKHLDRAKAATKSAILMNLESRVPTNNFHRCFLRYEMCDFLMVCVILADDCSRRHR